MKDTLKVSMVIERLSDFFNKLGHEYIYGLITAIILISLFPIIQVPNPQNLGFNGDAEFFNFSGQSSDVQFNAKVIDFKANETMFYSLKNITIESNDGKIRFINYSNSLQVQYNEKFFQKLLNVDVDIYFKNLTLSKMSAYNGIELYGYINRNVPNKIKSNGGEVFILKDSVNYVVIGGEKYTDFQRISFEMDNTSYLNFFSEVVKLEARISDLKITSRLSKIFLFQGEGVFGLNNHIFDVKSTDVLNAEIEPSYQGKSFFRVDGTKIVFNGFAGSATLNTEDKIMSDLGYWLRNQPEKINAYAVVILVFLTLWYAYSTRSMLGEQTKSRKIAAMEKKLEHVYSPMNNALNKSKLYIESLPKDTIPNGYASFFNDLINNFEVINKDYGHLFDSDMKKHYKETYESWKQFLIDRSSTEKMLKNYKNLNESIKKFHEIVESKIKTEIELLNSLQS